ncbi:hypothetical protein BS47DRAFT_1392124 [Hydnum rufescens UP504]|uniref:non-specific serine/threonine protein kinase n=1 Tax=Hydnum rufescens UP504 TaxID=1448309 RepID=A0A9P6AZF7_9AGAM|nr:hypothetical protein BS47DRAFT_1392124 [Hydnum rufescens UP504]
MCSAGTTTFPEEPLLKILEQGAGFFPARPGLVLGDGKYRILRKLGWGQHSSPWLVDGLRFTPKRYFTVKILTAKATHSHHAGDTHELELLRSIKDVRFSRLPHLHDDFELSGPHGRHLCFVMDLLSTSAQALRMSTPTQTLAVHSVKTIIALLLEGLTELHDLGIVHTDTKADNILFEVGAEEVIIAPILASEPLAIEGSFELEGQSYPILRSQPITPRVRWDDDWLRAEDWSISLIDLGYGLRPGKDLLPITTFELLTGVSLFAPEGNSDWSYEDDHLAKMHELTGDSFSTSFLERATRSKDYFTARRCVQGTLARIPNLTPTPIESILQQYSALLLEEDLKPAADFIRACTRIDPEERPPAETQVPGAITRMRPIVLPRPFHGSETDGFASKHAITSSAYCTYPNLWVRLLPQIIVRMCHNLIGINTGYSVIGSILKHKRTNIVLPGERTVV